MTLDQMYQSIRELTLRIEVLEAERVDEKYVLSLSGQREVLLHKLTSAAKDNG